jgi:hypothetical protein
MERTNNPWVCPSCGTSVDGDFDVCWKCQADRAGVQPATGVPEAEAEAQPAAALFDSSELPLQETETILMRYQDGYRVARVINGFGQTCKVVGISLGGLILLGCAMAESISGFVVVVGLVVGSIVGFVGWAIGVLISAQGQMVRATLDTAVNTSPFLSNEERAKTMSLT